MCCGSVVSPQVSHSVLLPRSSPAEEKKERCSNDISAAVSVHSLLTSGSEDTSGRGLKFSLFEGLTFNVC